MAQKKKATEAAPKNTTTKIEEEKDLNKVLDYFRYTVGTTLDCFFATGVLRNCITWYVQDLERMGLLQVIFIGRDQRTHFLAKHYSADPTKWEKKPDAQLSLFKEEV